MRPRLAVPLAATVLSAGLLAGCGTAPTRPAGPGTPGPGTTGPGTTGPVATGSPTSGSGTAGSDPVAAAFPLVLARTGGVAGFRERVTVERDGTTTVSLTRGEDGTCRLAAPTLERLRLAAQALPDVAVTTTDPGRADDLVTTLQGPSTRGPLRLPDAPADPVTVVGEILRDVAQPVADRTLCPPG